MLPIDLSREGLRRKVSFCLIGLSVAVLGAGALHLMIEVWYWYPSVAKAVELALGVWLNFKLNATYTWPNKDFKPKGALFVAFRGVTLAVSGGVFVVAVSAGIPIWMAQAISVGAGFIGNWVSTRWAFVPHGDVPQHIPLEDYKLGRNAAIMLGGTFILSVIGLKLVASDLFMVYLLLAASVLASSVGGLFLVSLLYSRRHGTSTLELRPRPLQGECRRYFAALMPGRHEASVFHGTIMNAVLTQLDHTACRFFPIICDDDTDTIRAALVAARTLHGWTRERLLRECDHDWLMAQMEKRLNRVVFDGRPLTEDELRDIAMFWDCDSLVQIIIYPLVGNPSKPKQMNYAFRLLDQQRGYYTDYPIVDAEDEIRPGLFTAADQRFQDEPDVDIVQGPVQLMPAHYSGSLRKRLAMLWHEWFTWLNALEYDRWFPNQLPFQARFRFVPLAGNTVFMSAELLRKTDGWLETLTEDAATGVVATAIHKAKVSVFYAPELTTLEKTPPTVQVWMKQRMRWDNGFFQALTDGHWRALPSFKQRVLAVWILANPFFQAFSALLLPVSIVTFFVLKSPVYYVLMMCVPVALMVVATVLQMRQLYEFKAAYGRKATLGAYLLVVGGQFPYQILLSVAAFRALLRWIRKDFSWDKSSRPEDAGFRAEQAAKQATLAMAAESEVA